MFNQFDTGDEGTGFRLPSYPQFDIPIMLTDKLLDPTTGLICFDTFNFDGLIGDVQLANGIVQPFFDVNKRRFAFGCWTPGRRASTSCSSPIRSVRTQ